MSDAPVAGPSEVPDDATVVLPPLGSLPRQPIPVLAEEAPRRPASLPVRPRSSGFSRLLVLVLLAVVSVGVSTGMALAGRPSLAAALVSGMLTLMLAVATVDAILRFGQRFR